MSRWVARSAGILPAVVLGLTAPLVSAQEVIDPLEAIDGTWLGGEIDDDDLEFTLVIEAGIGIVQRLGDRGADRPPIPVTAEATGPGMLRLNADDAGRQDSLLVAFQTRDIALIWEEDESDFGQMRRAIAVPDVLLGEWVMTDPGDPDDAIRLVIGADLVTAQPPRGAPPRSGQIRGLASSGTTIDLALDDVLRASASRVVLLHLQPLPDGAFFAWTQGDDDFAVLHAPGSAPAWLAAETPPPTDTTSTDICVQAGEHFLRCLTEACSARRNAPQICKSLDEMEAEFRSMSEYCPPEIQTEAAEVLGTSCEELVGPFLFE